VPTVQELPEYEQPPVVEVVCGVQFKEITSFIAPYLGLLWEKFKVEYPICQEVPPLASVVEKFTNFPFAEVHISETPPLPRIWFKQTSENGIVQVQRDRFLHNWKKVRSEDEYPHYESVIRMFRERLATFESFLTDANLGTIEPIQYELTYVNQIPLDEGSGSIKEIGTIFRDFTWHGDSERFLPEPESVNWRTSFVMLDNIGRLHVTIRNGSRQGDNTPILVLEITARGMPGEPSRDAMWRWFDLAHEWIVRGFEDLTTHQIQKVWRKTR
jgi:uncharacterized protein (TIGR04255 family)